MFEINYIFQKGGPNYSCHYPKQEDNNNNIFLIKGRNDQGKSTIMQIVALGLCGLESTDIDKTLKEKMLRLISPDTKCEFNFKIVSNDGKISLEAYMKDRRQTIKVGDKVKNATYIEDNFKILFDVPDDPAKKLISSLQSIEHNLRQYESYAQSYLNDIKQTIDALEKWEEKEQRLKDEKQSLTDRKDTLKQIEERLLQVENNFKESEKCRAVNLYDKLTKEFQHLDIELKNLEKRIKELKTAGTGGKSNSKYNRLMQNFRDALSILKFSVKTSMELERFLIGKEKEKLEVIIEEIDAIFTIKDLNNKKLKEWYAFYDKIVTNLESNPLYKKKLVEEEQIELINRLIPVLKDFIGINAIIPGTNGKSVGEFIKDLEVSKTDLEVKIAEKIALNDSRSVCNDVLKQLSNIATIHKNIPQKEESDAGNLEELLNQKNDIKTRIEATLKELDKIEDQVNSIPEPERARLLSTKDWVENEYETVKNEKIALEKKIKDLETKIAGSTELIKELERTSESSVKLDKGELNALFHTTETILRNLSSWIDYVSSVNLNEASIKNSEDQEGEKFYNALGEYFADVLRVIYFENKGWPVKKVDLLNHRYIVDERDPIDFVDFGTGHNQLNSFMARLKQNYGGRKKIVLFDELGVMDKNNVDRLLEEIKKQIISGELMFALLTQVDNNLNNVVLQPITI